MGHVWRGAAYAPCCRCILPGYDVLHWNARSGALRPFSMCLYIYLTYLCAIVCAQKPNPKDSSTSDEGFVSESPSLKPSPSSSKPGPSAGPVYGDVRACIMQEVTPVPPTAILPTVHEAPLEEKQRKTEMTLVPALRKVYRDITLAYLKDWLKPDYETEGTRRKAGSTPKYHPHPISLLKEFISEGLLVGDSPSPVKFGRLWANTCYNQGASTSDDLPEPPQSSIELLNEMYEDFRLVDQQEINLSGYSYKQPFVELVDDVILPFTCECSLHGTVLH